MSPGHEPAEQNERGTKRRSSLESLREYTPYLTLGFQLAAAVVLFFLVGAWLDNRWNASPWFKLSGLLLGSIGGFVKFFRSVADLEKKDQQAKGGP